MSLRVWLPLNGDLENKGISDITVTNNGATVDNNGKIGKCYNFSRKWISTEYSLYPQILSGDFSICFWTYCTTTGTRDIFFGNYGLSGSGNWMNIEKNASNKLRFWWNNGSPDYNFSNFTIEQNTWIHITLTKENNKITAYKNGSFIGSYSVTMSNSIPSTATIFYLGCDYRTNQEVDLDGKLNDFRIYDHCLSQKEVKEISQGLILHYKLDGLSTGLNNLAQTGSMRVYNNYSGSGTTGTLTKLNENFNGAPVYRLVMTPNDTSLSNFKTTLASHGVYGFGQTFKANTKYCFWIYYRPISHLDVRVGGTASNIAGWTEIAPKQVSSKWYRVGQFRNGSVTEDKTDNIFTSFYTPTAASGQPITIDFASPFLIEGSTNIDEGAYWGLNGINKISDSSGYGNDGTVLGAPTTVIDSERYNTSTHFEDTSSKIKIDNLTTSGFGDSYSFVWWAKINSANPMHWGFANGVRLNGMYTGRLWNTGDGSDNPLYNPGTTTQVTAPTVNVWHHWAMVGNGTKCLVYQDGELWAEAKTYKSISGTMIYINGWNSSTSYSSNNLFMSDFRIYATALSAEDVATLYHTSAQVDDLGGIHAFELEEKQGNSLTAELLGIYNSTSANWDNQNNQFTIISRNGISSRSGMVIKNVDSRRLIPWGFTYRFTFDIYVPITTNFNVDYNNYSNDASITLSGNDNDNISKRLASSFTVNANTWTTVTLGSSNTNETKNPEHVTLYDQTSFGIKTDSVDAPVTWYLKNPQWYLVETEKFQIEQNGVFKTNFIKEDDLKNYASFRDNEKAAWATQFIEK